MKIICLVLFALPKIPRDAGYISMSNTCKTVILQILTENHYFARERN